MLAAHAAAIRAAPALRWIGYLSTTGVYGDRGGAEVDEATPPAPGQPRSQRRLEAERQWAALAAGRALDIFRVGGIYGPGRSAFDDLRAGTARRTLQPGHLFGRIHRDDIALAVLAAMRQAPPPGLRVLHLVDDEPAESAVVVEAAARLLGVAAAAGHPLRAGAARFVAHGAQLLVGESPCGECRDQGGARHRLALPELPGRASRHPRRGGAATASGVAAPGPAAATAGGRRP